MEPDAEFDAYLARQMDEAELPDQDFTLVLAARLARHRRRRELAFGGAVAVASAIAVVAAYFSGGSNVSMPDITAETIAATLVLVAVCSLVWIGTESGAAALTS